MLLTLEGCLDRQRRLRALLSEQRMDAAMIVHPHHIHLLSGWWMRPIFQPVLLITPDRSVLALPCATDDPAAV